MDAETCRYIAFVLTEKQTLASADLCLAAQFNLSGPANRALRWGLADGWMGRPESFAGLTTRAAGVEYALVSALYARGVQLGITLSKEWSRI